MSTSLPGISLGFILALAVLLGGWLGDRWARSAERLQGWLPYSAGLLLGLGFLHLIPEAVAAARGWAGVALLLGFGLQLLLDQMTGGLEHAHPYGSLSPLEGMGVLVGVCLHSFIEAWPLALAAAYPQTIGLLFLAILAHKTPMGLMLVHLLRSANWASRRIWTAISLLASMPLLGIAAATLVVQELPPAALGVLLGVSAGIFLYLAVFLLMENLVRGHRLIRTRFMVFLAGIGTAAVTALLTH